jgi:hypothetical protein
VASHHPVFGRAGKVTGVLAIPTKLIGALNVIIGVSLENAKMYQQSIRFTERRHAFVDLTLHSNEEAEAMSRS